MQRLDAALGHREAGVAAERRATIWQTVTDRSASGLNGIVAPAAVPVLAPDDQLHRQPQLLLDLLAQLPEGTMPRASARNRVAKPWPYMGPCRVGCALMQEAGRPSAFSLVSTK